MYARMHVCTYACMHVCMYACMHVRMYACMHGFTNTENKRKHKQESLKEEQNGEKRKKKSHKKKNTPPNPTGRRVSSGAPIFLEETKHALLCRTAQREPRSRTPCCLAKQRETKKLTAQRPLDLERNRIRETYSTLLPKQ